MKRLLPLAGVILLGFGFLLWWWMTAGDREEREHFEREETELIVARAADAELTLFKAGRTLADTVRIEQFDGHRIWLTPGNYFVRSKHPTATVFYPVPLTGYRCGPDKDGSFVVTIRTAPHVSPPTLSDSLPPFVYIPSGSFLMGDRQNPRETHYVWVTAFFMAPFEVTNDEFRRFLSAPDGYNDDANWTEQGRRWRKSAKSHVSALLRPEYPDYRRFGRADVPVTWVTWFEANAFCKWLMRRFPGWLFSLPTDAEWEKAARGPDNFDYALSMFVSDAEEHLYNWRKNPDAPVPLFGIEESRRLFRPNRYGLYHMTGNVVEWTQSTDKPFNRENPFVNDERNRDDAAGKRTARGGSWYSAATSYLYIPYRDSFQPEHSTQDIGFRVVAKVLP
jgi:formylglycine-generating enzyme required for sulfatase activity